ncbi:hypothetical protein EUGRSUZ_K02757 [Eucalyptus grandis]|uniref:Uncharacterized protein n=2 Tax=Eucalyptus grandis TaxID=71139 RepID=A0ACC3IXD2_EUCGR|nr:hypothetical protein EUGRSUZ_K02757 [Eucalyptus grandis]
MPERLMTLYLHPTPSNHSSSLRRKCQGPSPSIPLHPRPTRILLSTIPRLKKQASAAPEMECHLQKTQFQEEGWS